MITGLGAINEHNAALAAPPGEEAAKPAFRVGQDATGANYEQFAAAPPVEDGLEGKVRELVLGSWRAHVKPIQWMKWYATLPPSSAPATPSSSA